MLEMHLFEGPDLGHYQFIIRWERKEVKEKSPAPGEPTTSGVFAPEACALPLCNNRCPHLFGVDDSLDERRSDVGRGTDGAGRDSGDEQRRARPSRRHRQHASGDGQAAADDAGARAQGPGDLAPEKNEQN